MPVCTLGLALGLILPLPCFGGGFDANPGKAKWPATSSSRMRKVPATYNAGFSLYVGRLAPVAANTRGISFQSGPARQLGCLPSYDGSGSHQRFTPLIEGGLGWWRDTRLPPRPPKFIMAGSAQFQRNGPTGRVRARTGTGTNRRASTAWPSSAPGSCGPPDGLNLKQGTCG